MYMRAQIRHFIKNFKRILKIGGRAEPWGRLYIQIKMNISDETGRLFLRLYDEDKFFMKNAPAPLQKFGKGVC